MACPKNTFADSEGSEICTPCGAGYQTEASGASICVAEEEVDDDCTGALCGVTENTGLSTAAAGGALGACALLLLCGLSW